MATPKSNLQMWKEFGAWLRAEDVSAYMGKATGAKEVTAKTSSKRANDLKAKYGPKDVLGRSLGSAKTPAKKIDVLGRSPIPSKKSIGGGRGTNTGNPGAKPNTSVGGGRGTNTGNPGTKTKPPVRTSRKTNDAIPNSMKRKTK